MQPDWEGGGPVVEAERLQEEWAERAGRWCRRVYNENWRTHLANLILATQSARRCADLGQLYTHKL